MQVTTPTLSLVAPNRNRQLRQSAWSWGIAACCAWLIMGSSLASGVDILWDENVDADGGDGTSWTSAPNWFDPTNGSDLAPTAADQVFIGYAATKEGDATPGLTSLSPTLNLGGNQSVAAFRIASVDFNDRNITSLAAQNISVDFDNGGNSYSLSTGTLDMAFSNRASGVNTAQLTLGNPLSSDPNQTLIVTSLAEVGTLRSADATLTVQNGGTINIGTSTAARAGLTIGRQRSGVVSTSAGLVEATGGVFTGFISSLVIGWNESTTTSSPANLGTGTLDLTGVVLGQGGNVLDVNSAELASRTNNGDAQQAFVNLGEGVARFGAITLGRPNAAGGALLTQAEMNLDGTIVTVDAGGVVINGTGVINVTASGDNAGLDLPVGVPVTINGGELNITFEDSTLPVDEIYWGMRAVGDRVAEFQSLSGLNIIDNADLGEPTIFEANGFTYIGFVVPQVPEPSSFVLVGLAMLALVRRQRFRHRLRS